MYAYACAYAYGHLYGHMYGHVLRHVYDDVYGSTLDYHGSLSASGALKQATCVQTGEYRRVHRHGWSGV